MSRNEFVKLDFARDETVVPDVYQCELLADSTKIIAGALPPLCIAAKVDDFVDVVLCHIDSPTRFYAQLKTSDVIALNKKMALLYADVNVQKPLQNPRKGNCCAVKRVKDASNQLWYRATVIGRTSPTKLEVYFVDYGTRVTIPLADAKELHPECKELPPQAFECKLQHVENVADVDVVKNFHDVCKTEDMVIRIVNKEASALVVILYKVVGDADYSINDYLLGKGPAPPVINAVDTNVSSVLESVLGSGGQNTGNSTYQTRGSSQRGGGPRAAAGGGSDFRPETHDERPRTGESRWSGVGDRAGDFGDRTRGGFSSDRGRGGARGSRSADYGGDHGYVGRFGSEREGGFGRGRDSGGGFGNDRSGSFGAYCGERVGGDNRRYGSGDRGGGTSTFQRGFNSSGPRQESFYKDNSSWKKEMSTQEKTTTFDDNNNGTKSAPVTNAKVGFRRRAFNVNDTFAGNIIQAKSPYDFWITTARGSGFNLLPDSMWAYSKSKCFAPLKDAVVGESCIVLEAATAESNFPIYCRAMIIGITGNSCDLLMVDYAKTNLSQPLNSLLEVPPEFATLECQAIKCKLANADEFYAQFHDDEKRKAFVDAVEETDVVATVKGFGENGVSLVDVYFGSNQANLLEQCKRIALGANSVGRC